MESAIYLLCAATALICGLLLLRSFQRTGFRFLLWCGIFFLAMMLENVALFVDLVIVPTTDLSSISLAVPLVGALLLMYGLVWEVK